MKLSELVLSHLITDNIIIEDELGKLYSFDGHSVRNSEYDFVLQNTSVDVPGVFRTRQYSFSEIKDWRVIPRVEPREGNGKES